MSELTWATRWDGAAAVRSSPKSNAGTVAGSPAERGPCRRPASAANEERSDRGALDRFAPPAPFDPLADLPRPARSGRPERLKPSSVGKRSSGRMEEGIRIRANGRPARSCSTQAHRRP
jgi:hypothetical protein